MDVSGLLPLLSKLAHPLRDVRCRAAESLSGKLRRRLLPGASAVGSAPRAELRSLAEAILRYLSTEGEDGGDEGLKVALADYMLEIVRQGGDSVRRALVGGRVDEKAEASARVAGERLPVQARESLMEVRNILQQQQQQQQQPGGEPERSGQAGAEARRRGLSEDCVDFAALERNCCLLLAMQHGQAVHEDEDEDEEGEQQQQGLGRTMTALRVSADGNGMGEHGLWKVRGPLRVLIDSGWLFFF